MAVKTVVAGLMIVLLLVSALLSVSSVHALVHRGERAADSHQCALCLFAHGQLDATDPTPVLVLRCTVTTVAVFAAFPTAVPAPDYQLLPERGPPACSTLLAS